MREERGKERSMVVYVVYRCAILLISSYHSIINHTYISSLHSRYRPKRHLPHLQGGPRSRTTTRHVLQLREEKKAVKKRKRRNERTSTSKVSQEKETRPPSRRYIYLLRKEKAQFLESVLGRLSTVTPCLFRSSEDFILVRVQSTDRDAIAFRFVRVVSLD